MGLGTCLCCTSVQILFNWCESCAASPYITADCDKCIQHVGIICGAVSAIPFCPVASVAACCGCICNKYPYCCHYVNTHVAYENRQDIFQTTKGPTRQSFD